MLLFLELLLFLLLTLLRCCCLRTQQWPKVCDVSGCLMKCLSSLQTTDPDETDMSSKCVLAGLESELCLHQGGAEGRSGR